MAEIAWPTKATSDGKDLLVPTKDLVVGLGLAPPDDVSKPNPIGALFGTAPDSVTVIKSYALGVSKVWVTLFAASGIGTAAVGLVAKFWSDSPENIRVATILAAGFAMAAIALAISYVVGSDVRGRASATTEQLSQRGSVVCAFLQTAAQANSGAVSTTPPASR